MDYMGEEKGKSITQTGTLSGGLQAKALDG
jgi:hypothetical protein